MLFIKKLVFITMLLSLSQATYAMRYTRGENIQALSFTKRAAFQQEPTSINRAALLSATAVSVLFLGHLIYTHGISATFANEATIPATVAVGATGDAVGASLQFAHERRQNYAQKNTECLQPFGRE